MYKHLRHPSYAGYLLGNLGLGMAFSNWLSIVIIFVPILAASLYRIWVEEDALLENFGDETKQCLTEFRPLNGQSKNSASLAPATA